MPNMFTESGIKKLVELKNKLAAIKTFNFPGKTSSDFSKKMTEDAIKIIELLIDPKHNNIIYWMKSDNQNSIVELASKLDNNQGTFVPEVFNQESRMLAGFLIDALRNINFKEDISVDYPNSQIILNIMIEYLQSKINFYDVLSNNNENVKLKAAVEEEILLKFKEFDTTIRKDLSDANYESFKSHYEQSAEELINRIHKLPYVRITNSSSFVDAEEPYKLNSKEVFSAGNRGAVISVILRCEENINKLLQAKKLPLVMTFYNHYNSKFKPESYQKAEKKFSSIMASFKEDKAKYLIGEFNNDTNAGNGLFGKFKKSPGKAKVLIINQLEKLMDTTAGELTVKKDALLPTGIRAFNMFKCMLDAAEANEELCAAKNISLGNLSKLTNKYKWLLFNLSSGEIDETCDAGIGNSLNQYHKYLNLDLPPIIIGNEIDPSMSAGQSNTTTASSLPGCKP